MNAPYFESSEQLDCFFPSSLHKIKFHIYQNISKCSIHGLISFKYNNTCDLCDKIIHEYNKSRIILNKCLVIHEEVINVFPTTEKLSFCLAHVRIIGSMECGRLEMIVSALMHQNIYKVENIM